MKRWHNRILAHRVALNVIFANCSAIATGIALIIRILITIDPVLSRVPTPRVNQSI